MKKQFKGVIFDLDGTLIDSMWVWPELDKHYLGQFNIPVPEDLDQALEGKSFTESAVYFKERFELVHTIEEIKESWNQLAWEFYTTKVPLKPYAKAFLDQLKEAHIPMGIATSNSIELVTAVLEHLEILDYFQVIRTSCEVEKGKPAPDIYLRVAKELNLNPADCLVFEDVPNGVLAGKRAGMTVWGVYDGQSKGVQEKILEQAERMIDDYREAIDYFDFLY